MIHTKQPANQFYVFLTAYRSYETTEVNEIHTRGMASEIRKLPWTYGVIENGDVQGCFKEAGTEVAINERTLKVRARNENEMANLVYLACKVYDQDVVLVVNSQTHTAALGTIEMVGAYPMQYPRLKLEVIGTFTQQDTGSEHYSIINGERWEVA